MRSLLAFAIAFARAWTATYTRGLPADVRAERREEIDCDLWHHQRLAELQREPVTGTAVEILVRVVLGIPSDLLWRVEAGSTSPTTGRTSVNDTWPMRIGFLIALVPLAMVASIAFFGSWEDSEPVIWRIAFFVCPLAAALGLLLCRRAPALGLGLVVAGAISSAFLMYWMAFITVPIALAVIAFAIKRSGVAVWPFRGPRPSASGSV